MTADDLTASLTGASTGSPVHIWVATANQTISSSGFNDDLFSKVHYDTIRIEETGSHDGVHADFEITDLSAAYDAIRGEWPVRITKVLSGVEDTLFLGFIRQSRGKYEAKYGGKMVSAVDFSSLLDRDAVKTPFTIAAGTNAKAAIQTCFNTMTILQQFGASLDYSKVRNDLGEDGDGELPDKVKFERGLTLRQCIERILGEVSATANYRMDFTPKLWTWDANTLTAMHTALGSPYDINVTPNPDSDEVAPEDLEHEWDTDRRISAVVIDGAKAAGSGTFADKDKLPDDLIGDPIDKFGGRILPGPWSADLWGISHAPLTGQPSTTAKQAIRLARAALIDLRNPIPVGSFSVRQSSCYNGTQRWAGGQYVYVTSAQLGLTGRVADPRPWAGSNSDTPGTRWALQPFRISRVTTTFVNGAGDLKQDIEYGGRRQHLSQV